MKVSLIAWRLFWEAFDKQESDGLDGWLARWVFANDGVRLSMRSRRFNSRNADLAVDHRKVAGGNPHAGVRPELQ